jgi:hypothetical protein
MADNNVELMNVALTRLGAPKISNEDELTREAEVMTTLFEPVYENILSQTNWNFAIVDTELARTTVTPTDPNFLYAYTLPTDYFNTVNVYDNAGVTIGTYALQNGEILSNSSRVFLKYVQKPTVDKLPAWFTMLFALQLAVSAQEAIIGIGTVQDRLAQELEQQRLFAFKLNQQEDTLSDNLAPSTYVSIRS